MSNCNAYPHVELLLAYVKNSPVEATITGQRRQTPTELIVQQIPMILARETGGVNSLKLHPTCSLYSRFCMSKQFANNVFYQLSFHLCSRCGDFIVGFFIHIKTKMPLLNESCNLATYSPQSLRLSAVFQAYRIDENE